MSLIHHPIDLESRLGAAAAWCHARGEKLTEQRREVLSLLLAEHGSVKAYDLLAKLQKQKPTAAPPTVYRALDFLVAVGLAHKLGSINAFVACCDFDHLHQGVMLVCDDCHGVTELQHSMVAEQLADEARGVGFQVAPQDIELHGRCNACRAQDEEA